MDDGNKFYEFYNYVDKIVLEYKPNVLCIEKPMSMLNGNTTRTLIGLYSMLKMIATMRRVRISEVFPTSMKKLICGSGRAEKSELAIALTSILKCDVSDIVEYEMYSTSAKRGQIKKTMYDISDSIGLIVYTIMSGGKKIE